MEDYERLNRMDRMYLIEANRQMEEEWQQWEHEEKIRNKPPAKITVVVVPETIITQSNGKY